MSFDAYRLLLMKRAMARTDKELFGRRHLYEACARQLAAQIIGGAS